MTDVLDRLTGAMSAAAGTVREHDLRPLTAPERPRRRRHRPAWAVPVAAAAAVVLVIGLAASVSHGLFGPRSPAGRAARPPRRCGSTSRRTCPSRRSWSARRAPARSSRSSR